MQGIRRAVREVFEVIWRCLGMRAAEWHSPFSGRCDPAALSTPLPTKEYSGE
uniref:Uncharacterized protein n=1 Tax=Candidatus Kentrum sp. UNK TaxID=2126344 RepID=A0A451B6Q8_9GAMM|nr:MAG: hypothetical protein BECKUNK1418G_GA0071005_14361 [Candidatus Kentron sp. UNK]VFK73989.1 MAG: hypothetical protein BECKUNK1418H_GA0071006_14251 [Candidatus Kentron sp. UNK]